MELDYMKLALELAGKARGRTSPNPLVGAVVVKEGEIVGQGYHRKAGTAHAEVIALEDAGSGAQGADLYVTLEPCNHQGRTPPCTTAIIEAGIKRVFIAAGDPNPLVSGTGAARLKDSGIEVIEGVMEGEANKQNEVFFKYIRTKIPFVALKSAMSLDGKIATERGESRWITGEEARLHGHSLRDTYDAILVGSGTVLTDDPSLTCRLPSGDGRDPIRIVVDSKLTISEEARVLNLNSQAPTIIATTAKASPEKIRRLEKKASVMLINDGPRVDLPSLLRELAEMEITSVLVEGGSAINGSFLQGNLVDKFFFYLAPKIIGGTKAPGPFGGSGFSVLKEITPLRDLEITPLGQDLLITGYPEGERSR